MFDKMVKDKQKRKESRSLLKTTAVLSKYGLLRSASRILGIDRNRFLRVEKEKKLGQRKSALSKDTVDSVQAYYEDHATHLPHKKAFFKKLGKTKAYLSRIVTDLYRNFKEENPDISIRFSKFAELRPSMSYVPRTKSWNNVCANIAQTHCCNFSRSITWQKKRRWLIAKSWTSARPSKSPCAQWIQVSSTTTRTVSTGNARTVEWKTLVNLSLIFSLPAVTITLNGYIGIPSIKAGYPAIHH